MRNGNLHAVHTAYHNLEYGFPLRTDDALFERLMLEINQAGLSWETILKKREGFTRAYAGFHLETVAAFTDEDVARLLADSSIIRNRLKINAAITNAQRVLELRESHGSFAAWLDAHHPLEKADWVKLFKRTFTFTGGEIVGEFLISTGYLRGAHDADCPVHATILERSPAWNR
ncbi:MAG: DNA-3-methyladenine glycosylase I [Pleurocapsa sp. SU_196_0]|nr:DNA-3-methyladenine glycosylase I [Pleurocapsa sp. SU_196_0]